uniref:Uncharacterized protein n=1 Tax=Dicentrarchus labrax TaxID=13489 RepID=A0A8C4IHR3_DICLA
MKKIAFKTARLLQTPLSATWCWNTQAKPATPCEQSQKVLTQTKGRCNISPPDHFATVVPATKARL